MNKNNENKAPWGGGIPNRSRERVIQSLHDNGVIYYSHNCTPKKFSTWCSICGYHIGTLQKSVAWTSYKYAGLFILCEYCDSIAEQEMVKLVEKLTALLDEKNDTEKEE